MSAKRSNRRLEPKFLETAFCCPYCGVLAAQVWEPMSGDSFGLGKSMSEAKLCQHAFIFSYCTSCRKFSVWETDEKRMVYPDSAGIEPPNPDLIDDAQTLYNEAASIVNRSPAGACALLRLCLEKFCNEQMGKSGGLFSMIGDLVREDNMSPKLQKAADSIRHTGNDAVHTGEISLQDDRDTAIKMFKLVNLIVYEMVTQPREIDEYFESLPEEKRAGIKQRDLVE